MSLVQKTLPIKVTDGMDLDISEARAIGKELAGIYTESQPFPHIVIDNFLPPELIDNIYKHFPAEEVNSEKHFESGYRGLHKRQINPNYCDAYLKNVFLFLNSAPMLRFLEQLSSIHGLIPDPYFNGGGLHETKAGGFLGIHTDFRVYEGLRLERRLNMIIYLNKDWKEEYGGNLELWDTKMKTCVSKVSPIYNRCVVFNTNADSNHGHPEPLNTPEGITRRSIALYYYTASDKIFDDIKLRTTVYKPRPIDAPYLRAKYFVKNLIKTIRSYWA